ncbi:hypothetical protein SKAU_G00205210 [Synaphobranchus kaupii]|uniref:GATA zinc finger domain containing 2A n=1 Tax=Synaphobranchus kaupii TaxID=118154 RepID=A0A9Q1IWG9_SYNKA|nr:hypothetical protein SKAU_G00205210 [Synaphobranchus kaupii]
MGMNSWCSEAITATAKSPKSRGRTGDKRITPPRLRVEMSEEAVRQTRSQKRALERDAPPVEIESKKVRLDRGDVMKSDAGGGAGGGGGGGGGGKAEPVGRVPSILNAGEVKATIKVEVQTGDEPVDMSTSKSNVKGERRPPSPDDVIVLSDNEPSSPPINGLNHFPKEMDTERLLRSSPEERDRIIKQLKEELRLEEAKLVLLKKLRQSQVQKEASAQKNTGSSGSVATPPPLVRGSIATNKGTLQVVSGRSLGGVIPPPLVRGGQQASSKPGSQNSHTVMPPLVRGAQPIQVQGQRVIQPGLIRVANVANASLLVNISQASASSLKGSTVTSQSQLTGGNVSSVSANESPASRQAAAKLALRKQLEKTLLEIPPPKPPAPELNFLPSAANNEFIYLVGLEEVVQNLLDVLAKGKPQAPPAPKDPYSCSQCKTDFTSRWRQGKSGSAVMCEHCLTSGQKRALKAEHTSRLKAAFVKALQQEQEIEQRILQQTSASPASSRAPSSSSSVVVKVEPQLVKQHARSTVASLQVHGRVTPVARHHSAIKQNAGQLSRSIQPTVVRGVTHAFSPSPQIQNAVAAAALVTRPGKHGTHAVSKASGSHHTAASTWRIQNRGTTGVTMAYVNPSLTAHKSSSAVDRQREYLLDMIPSRSISQAANAWK